MVTLDPGGEARSLSVATSYIRQTVGAASAPAALIAVFSDITELRELRETELRMAKAVEAQHGELQSAYRQIEERNETLARTLKKVQAARIGATVLAIGVFWLPAHMCGSRSTASTSRFSAARRIRR